MLIKQKNFLRILRANIKSINSNKFNHQVFEEITGFKTSNLSKKIFDKIDKL